MSTQAPPRTSQAVQQESANLQFKAGALQYSVAQQAKELTMINDRLRDLAIEWNALQTQEANEARIRAEVKKEAEDAKPKLAAAEDQKPSSVDQATTQAGSEAVPKPSQQGPDGQSQKKE